MRVETVKVTPELAAQWLTKNTVNRDINQYRVYTYASEMKAGRWRLNGDSIRFAKDGTMLDGQHRLWAVVESQVPVTMMVVWDLDAEVRPTIDTGRPRSTADFFKMIDGTPNAQRVVATIRIIESLYTSQRAPVSYDLAKERYDRFREGIDWAIKTFPTSGNAKVDKTPVVAAMALAYPANKTRANEFANKLRTGANVKVGDPALTLRNYLLERLPVKRDDSRTIAIKVLSAFYAYLNNIETTKIYGKEDALNHFLRLYPEIQRGSPLKRLVAQPIAPAVTEQEALDIQIKRVQRTIDIQRPWATKQKRRNVSVS